MTEDEVKQSLTPSGFISNIKSLFGMESQDQQMKHQPLY